MLVYPSGGDVSTSTLRYLSACLRTRRRAAGTQRPDALYADRGYDHDKYRKQVREAGIKPVIARCGEQHDSGLGVYRWVVEQGFAQLHSAGSASDGKSATTSTKPSSARLRHHLLARLRNISNC